MVILKRSAARSRPAGGGDQIAVEKADRRVKELKEHIDNADKVILWPALLHDYKERLTDTQDTVESWGGAAEYADRLALLKKDAEKAITLKDSKRLIKALEDMNDLKWEILFRQKILDRRFSGIAAKRSERFCESKARFRIIGRRRPRALRQDTESVQVSRSSCGS